jgi:hypothetical protein
MGGNQNEGNAARNNGSCEKEGVDFQQANLSHLLLLCKINSHRPRSNFQQVAIRETIYLENQCCELTAAS